jgi:formylglycine-generating enzyme
MKRARWLGLVALGGLARCDAPTTELVVFLDSNIADLERVRLVATREGATTPLLDRWYPIARGLDGGFSLPGEVGLLAASGDDARPVRLAVTADVSGDALDFTLNFAARFRPNRVGWVEVFLSDRCRDPIARKCPFGQVCGLTSCEPVDRPVTDVRPTRDAATDLPTDAVTDAVIDAAIDSAIDARTPPDAPALPDAAEVADATVVSDRPDAFDGAAVIDAPDVADASPMRDAPTCLDGRPPTLEVCYNGVDDNCDGVSDEGCAPRSCASATAPGCGQTVVSFVVDGFDMGEIGTPSASPTVRVFTSSFAIDRYEVTVERFRAFWNAGHPAPPMGVVDYPGVTLTMPALPVVPPVMYVGPADAAVAECVWTNASASPLLPINCVSWATAMAFCVWDGGRLPTEAEWEAAARFGPALMLDGRPAPAGRRYPWGNDPPTCQSNYAERSLSCGPRPGAQWIVGTAQPSTWPLFDLSGNAQEWVADVASRYASAPCWVGTSFHNPLCLTVGGDPLLEERVVRGGSNTSLEPGVRATSRDTSRPTNNGSNKGFRCVRMGA